MKIITFKVASFRQFILVRVQNEAFSFFVLLTDPVGLVSQLSSSITISQQSVSPERSGKTILAYCSGSEDHPKHLTAAWNVEDGSGRFRLDLKVDLVLIFATFSERILGNESSRFAPCGRSTCS
jgi:hypothetical protein